MALGALIGIPVSCSALGAILKADEARASRLISSAYIEDGAGRRIAVGKGVDQARVDGPAGAANLVVTYSGAKAGKDRMSIILSGPGSRGRCSEAVLATSAGVAQCGFRELPEAPYTFIVSINGDEVARYSMSVTDSARPLGMVRGVKIAENVKAGFSGVSDTRTIFGAPSPAGVVVKYSNGRAGDRIDADLYVNGRLIDSCNPFKLGGSASGDYWCQFDSVGAGQAEFRISINGVSVGRYAFVVRAQEAAASDAAALQPTEDRAAPRGDATARTAGRPLEFTETPAPSDRGRGAAEHQPPSALQFTEKPR